MGRTVVIGDVHGCLAELDDLLLEVDFREQDHLVFVGDVAARGPDGRGVLARMRELGARAVRGNHEERLLKVRQARAVGERGPRLSPAHQRLFDELTELDFEQMVSFPLWLDLSPTVRVVHAGVDPRYPIAEQKPEVLMTVRTITDSGEPSSKWAGLRWGELYLTTPHLIFGHNAQRAVQLHNNATGIDTGCVYGGALTAIVLESGVPVGYPERLAQMVSVPARRAYANYGRELSAGCGADRVVPLAQPTPVVGQQ